MNLTLSNFFLLNETNLPNLLLINANEDYTSAIHYATCHMKQSINNINLYSFTVDRYFTFDAIYQILNNTSLFDNKNYIELNYKTKPTPEHQTQLQNIYPLLQKNNHLVIITDYLNKREQTSKWIDFINQNGIILTLNQSILPQLISHMLISYDLTFTVNAINFLIEQNYSNITQLIQQVNTIALYFQNKKNIDLIDIQAIASNNAQYDVYKLSNAYLSGDLDLSIKILENIYYTNEDAILICWILNEDIRKLLKIKSKLRTNNNLAQIIRELGIWGTAITHITKANERLQYKTLIKILAMLSQLDLITKGLYNTQAKIHIINILKIITHPTLKHD